MKTVLLHVEVLTGKKNQDFGKERIRILAKENEKVLIHWEKSGFFSLGYKLVYFVFTR